MTNNQRFNYRNRGVSEANTKLILASLKNGQKTITELMMVTGLTRPTVVKKLNSLSDEIGVSETHPKVYYLKSVGYETVVDEIKQANTVQTKMEIAKNAILHGTPAALSNPVFFPEATHHDQSKFHDAIIGTDADDPLYVFYRSIDSAKSLKMAEHAIKVMYDLLQFRKTLKEF